MTPREAILEGAQGAFRVHNQLHIREKVQQRRSPVDVFGSLLALNATVMFRPLDGLLGACLPGPNPGVIISTKRPLPIQRFTGAHELGHLAMGHGQSLDGEEILAPEVPDTSDLIEVQANAFASEFLLPRWLMALHATAQGWNRESLKDEAIVYQLSLRLGTSYDATCRALHSHKLIDLQTLQRHLAVQPKSIKQRLLKGYTPENWRRNVWLLTEHDEGAILAGQPDDVFLFVLNEKSGAGYLWDVNDIQERGFTIVSDLRRPLGIPEEVGSDMQRAITAQSAQSAIGELELAMRRPWERLDTSAHHLHLYYDLRGKEEIGLPRAYREQRMAA